MSEQDISWSDSGKEGPESIECLTDCKPELMHTLSLSHWVFIVCVGYHYSISSKTIITSVNSEWVPLYR